MALRAGGMRSRGVRTGSMCSCGVCSRSNRGSSEACDLRRSDILRAGGSSQGEATLALVVLVIARLDG